MAERRLRRPRRRHAPLRPGPRASSSPSTGMPRRPRRPSVAAGLGLTERNLGQPLRTLSGGQRRRVELARILFGEAGTLLLDEPTNHLDADSIVWLRGFLADAQGRSGRHQPRRRAARDGRQPGASTWTPTGASSTSTTSGGAPTSSSARPTSGAGTGSGRTPRSRQRRSSARPTGCGPRRRRPGRRSRCSKRADRLLSGLEDAARRRPRGQAAVPRSRCRAAGPRCGQRAEQVLRVPGGLRRRRAGDRPGLPGRHPRA